MPLDAQTITSRLDRLLDEVSAGIIGQTPPWDSDDVIITPMHPRPSDDCDFYPTTRWVVTQHAWELNWLLHRLKDAFGQAIEIRSRYVFFGRLADAANWYLAATPPRDQTAKTLLQAVMTEARKMADELEP